MKSPKIKKPYKKPQQLADGSFVKGAGQYLKNIGLATADMALGTVGANNVIQDEQYQGVGSKLAKTTAGVGGTVGRVLAPTLLGALGVPPELTSGLQTAIGNEFNPESTQAKEKRLADEKANTKQNLATSFANNYTQTLNDREMANYSEGGPIKGKGGPKSDSIKAEIKEKSFVVPAENAGIAKVIRETYIGKSKPAKLKQEDGEDVKLSNGEHLFTPEEYQFLKTKGVDLEHLAPNADYYTADANSFSLGGLTPEKARIMLHDGTINGKPITDKQRKFFGWASNGYANGGGVKASDEQAKIKAENDKANKQKVLKIYGDYKSKKATEANNAKSEALAERGKRRLESQSKLDKSLRELKAAEQAYQNYVKQTEADYNYTQSSADRRIGAGKGSESQRAEILKKRQELLNAVKEKQSFYKKSKDDYDVFDKKPTAGNTGNTDYFNPEKTIGTGKSETADESMAKTETKPVTTTTKPTLKPTKISPVKQQLQTAQAANINTNGTSSLDNEIFSKKTLENRESEVVAPPVDETTLSPQAKENLKVSQEATVQNNEPKPMANEPSLDAATTTDTGMQGGKKGLAASFDYVLPAYQMYAGQKMLNELGDRPVDTLDPEYLKNMNMNKLDLDMARRNARFGLTPEEQFELNQANQNALEAGRFAAKNYSGGSAANAFSLDQSAVNDAFTRKLGISKANRDAMLNKQGLVANVQGNYNNLVNDYQNRKRSLFGDKLNAWNIDQSAGAELQGAGIKNMVEASRYNTEKSLTEAIKKKYGI